MKEAYSLEALRICLRAAQEAVKGVTVRPEEPWLLFDVKEVELDAKGVWVSGAYRSEKKERKLLRLKWSPALEADRQAIAFLELHHRNGLALKPSEVMNCIIIDPA